MPYDVERALRDGIPEEEIAKHLAKTRNYRFDEAVKAGVPHREIIDYLAPQKPIGQKPTLPAVPSAQRPREPVVPAIEAPVKPPERPAQMPTLGISPPGVMGGDVMRHRPSPVTAEIDLTEIPKELTPSHEPFRSTLGVPPAEPSKDFGLRPDGTLKGTGFLGVLKRPDGKVSSEISIGVNIDGKEVEIPTLIPTLVQDEIDYLLSGGKPTDAIVGKATEHAKSRMAKGLSPFAREGERADAERAEQISLAERAKATAPSIGTLEDVTEPKPIIQRNLLELLGIVPVGRKPIFGEKGLGKEEIIRNQNIVQMANETNLPPSFVEENYDAITQKLGMRGVPTHKEMIQMLISAGIGRGIITAPLRTAMGLGTFLGVKELESLATQIGKGEVPQPLQGRELKEFLGPLDSRQNLIIDAMEFMVPGFLGTQIMLKTKGKLSKKLSDKIIDDAWDTYVEKQSKNLLEYKGKPSGETIQKLGQPLPKGAIPTEKPSRPISPGPTGLPASEPIGSTIPAPGQPPVTAKPSAPISPPGRIIPPAMQGPPSPAAKAQEIVGTTIPMGIPPIAPRPTVPVEAPQPIPGMGVASLAPPVQPPMEVPFQPIPQMMGMGQEMAAATPEARTPAEAEILAKVTALRENTDRLIQEGGYEVAKQQPRSQKGEQNLLRRGYKPMLWDEATGELSLNPLGVWVKEPAKPVEEVIPATPAPEEARLQTPLPPGPTQEIPPEVTAQPITEIPPVAEKPAILPVPEPQIEAQGVETVKGGLPYTQMREISAGTSVKVNGKDAKVNEINPDGTISVGFKGGGMADVRPEEITPTEPLAGPEVSKEALPVNEEGPDRTVPYHEGDIPPSEWKKDPVLVADAEAIINRLANEYPNAERVSPKDLDYVGIQDWLPVTSENAMHSWNVTKPGHPKHESTVQGPGFNLTPEQAGTIMAEHSGKKLLEETPTGSPIVEPLLQSAATQAIPPTAQHLELMPEEYPNIEAAALKQDGKIYKDHTHGNILIENNLDPEKAIPGFVTKEGKFIEQYPSEKVPAITQMREWEGGVTKESPGVFWHGTPSGDLRGSSNGLHIGTYRAARQALEARIGIPAEGEWDGTRKYGETKLAGKKRLLELDPKGYNQTGINAGILGKPVPEENYYPTEEATYTSGAKVSLDSMPDVFPVGITGGMTNSPRTPHSDDKANSLMRGQIKKGNPKSGYYYKNISEDEGSTSAVVPNASHLERIKRISEVQKGEVVPEPVTEDISDIPKWVLDKPRTVLRRAGVNSHAISQMSEEDARKFAIEEYRAKKEQFVNFVSGFGEVTEEVAPTISQTSAKKLLSLPYEQRTSPYGDQNAKFRQQILKELTGQDLPKNKAGSTRVREELTKAAGIDTTGKAPVEIDREIHEWLQEIAGVEKKAEVSPLEPTLPPGHRVVPQEVIKEVAKTTPPGMGVAEVAKPKKPTTTEKTRVASEKPSGRRISPKESSAYEYIAEYSPKRVSEADYAGEKKVLVGEGWFTNGQYMIKGEPPATFGKKAKKEVLTKETIKQATPSLKDMSPATHVAEFHVMDAHTNSGITISDKGSAQFNPALMDVIRKHQPDATLYIKDENSPMAFVKDKKVVGILMPMRGDPTGGLVDKYFADQGIKVPWEKEVLKEEVKVEEKEPFRLTGDLQNVGDVTMQLVQIPVGDRVAWGDKGWEKTSVGWKPVGEYAPSKSSQQFASKIAEEIRITKKPVEPSKTEPIGDIEQLRRKAFETNEVSQKADTAWRQWSTAGPHEVTGRTAEEKQVNFNSELNKRVKAKKDAESEAGKADKEYRMAVIEKSIDEINEEDYQKMKAGTEDRIKQNVMNKAKRELDADRITQEKYDELAKKYGTEKTEVKDPWEMKPEEFPAWEDTRVKRISPTEPPVGFSEEEMWAASLKNRNLETTPPPHNKFPVGQWAKDSAGELMQLREYDINDSILEFPEGKPKNQTVDKYAQWIREGNDPPPMDAVETLSGKVRVNEGHHRLAAIEKAGGNKVKIWVSVTREQEGHPRGVKPENAEILKQTPEGVIEKVAPQEGVEKTKEPAMLRTLRERAKNFNTYDEFRQWFVLEGKNLFKGDTRISKLTRELETNQATRAQSPVDIFNKHLRQSTEFSNLKELYEDVKAKEGKASISDFGKKIGGAGTIPPWEMTPGQYKASGLGPANDVEVLKAAKRGERVNALAVAEYNLKDSLPVGFTKEGDFYVPPPGENDRKTELLKIKRSLEMELLPFGKEYASLPPADRSKVDRDRATSKRYLENVNKELKAIEKTLSTAKEKKEPESYADEMKRRADEQYAGWKGKPPKEYPNLTVTGQESPVPNRTGASYVVHRGKPVLGDTRTYRVIMTKSEGGYATVDGKGETPEEAYDGALRNYDEMMAKRVKPITPPGTVSPLEQAPPGGWTEADKVSAPPGMVRAEEKPPKISEILSPDLEYERFISELSDADKKTAESFIIKNPRNPLNQIRAIKDAIARAAKTEEKPTNVVLGKPPTTGNRWFINDQTGKLQLHFSKADFDNLPDGIKKDIRGRFLWAPSKKAWVSKAYKDLYWPRQIVGRLEKEGVFQAAVEEKTPTEKMMETSLKLREGEMPGQPEERFKITGDESDKAYFDLGAKHAQTGQRYAPPMVGEEQYRKGYESAKIIPQMEDTGKKEGKYRISIPGEGRVPVEAEPIKLTGLDKYEFFVHKSYSDPKKWNVTESRSGMAMSGGDSKQAAIDGAESIPKDRAKNVLEQTYEGISIFKRAAELTDEELKKVMAPSPTPMEKRNTELGAFVSDPRFLVSLKPGEVGYQKSMSPENQPVRTDFESVREYLKTGKLSPEAKVIGDIANRLREIDPAYISVIASVKTSSQILNAAKTGNYNSSLHPDNKAARKLFEELIGRALPRGVKATQEMFVGTPFEIHPIEMAPGVKYELTMPEGAGKPLTEGQLQTEYSKRGYFVAVQPAGKYIISDKSDPLRGNLKIFAKARLENIDQTIKDYEEMAGSVVPKPTMPPGVGVTPSPKAEQPTKFAPPGMAPAEIPAEKPSWARTVYGQNYNKLAKLFDKWGLGRPGDFRGYQKLKAKEFMDFNVEYIRDDGEGNPILALSHYYEQQGDLIPDPDMEVRILKDGAIEALTFQDNRSHTEVYPEPGKVDLRAKKDLNSFLGTWLKNISEQGHAVEVPEKVGKTVEEMPTVAYPPGAVKYVSSLNRTLPKAVEYAEEYLRWLSQGRLEGKEPSIGELSANGAMAVRTELDQFYPEVEIIEVPQKGFAAETLAENKWGKNALVFATEEEAANYGTDLMSRWMGAKETRPVPVDQAPNHTFKDWKLERIEKPTEAVEPLIRTTKETSGVWKGGYRVTVTEGPHEGLLGFAHTPEGAKREVLKVIAEREGTVGTKETELETKEAPTEVPGPFYTTSGGMPWSEMVETEVVDRGNYSEEEVESWRKKYGIRSTDQVIWVSPSKATAASYQASAEERDAIIGLPDDQVNAELVDKPGFIIPESDDGSDGFLYVIKKTETTGIPVDVQEAIDKNAKDGWVGNLIKEREVRGIIKGLVSDPNEVERIFELAKQEKIEGIEFKPQTTRVAFGNKLRDRGVADAVVDNKPTTFKVMSDDQGFYLRTESEGERFDFPERFDDRADVIREGLEVAWGEPAKPTEENNIDWDAVMDVRDTISLKDPKIRASGTAARGNLTKALEMAGKGQDKLALDSLEEGYDRLSKTHPELAVALRNIIDKGTEPTKPLTSAEKESIAKLKGKEGEGDASKISKPSADTTKAQDDRIRAGGEGADNVPAPKKDWTTEDLRTGHGPESSGQLRGSGNKGASSFTKTEGLPGEPTEPKPSHKQGVGRGHGDVAGVQRPRRGLDHWINPTDLVREGSWRNQAKTNLDIIELVKKLEAEKRQATPEEQKLLAKYTGWGASELANKMFPGYSSRGEVSPSWADEDWKPLAERLVNLLTPEEIKTAANSTQFAHYTSAPVIRSIYRALEKFGFAGGKILEPGMGIGHFFGLLPDSMRGPSVYTGIEYDQSTASIAKYLYPNQNVLYADYTKQKLPNDFFDLAIGNPPFSSTKILVDPDYKKYRFNLHEYFFAKSLDKVRPGGILTFITSRYTMDKIDDKARAYLMDRADLIGAIRLPQTAFKENAGTEVVTDVLFFRKKISGEETIGKRWSELREVKTPEGPFHINEYFADHPEMILGKSSGQGSMYGGGIEYTVLPLEGNIEDHFADAVENLPENIYSVARQAPEVQKRAIVERDFNPTNKKEGGIYLSDRDELMIVESGTGIPLQPTKDIGEHGKSWLKGYVGIRDAVKKSHYDQLNDGPWETSLEDLQKKYKEFVKTHGRINQYTTYEGKETDEDGNEIKVERRRYKYGQLFKNDIEFPLVTSLELETETGDIIDGPALSGRTLKKPTPREIRTAPDALAVSLDIIGRLDLDHIGGFLNKPTGVVVEQLGDLIYKDPSRDAHILADEYLSGDVVTKLEEARVAAETDPQYQRNVEALIKAQPLPLTPMQVTVNLGAPWVPPAIVTDFTHEVLGLPSQTEATYNPADNSWEIGTKAEEVSGYSYRRRRRGGPQALRKQELRGATSEWGTPQRGANEILDSILNNKTIKITYTDEDKKTHVDVTATAAANDIAKKMKAHFKNWVWEDVDRTKELLDIWNSTKNNIASRRFDGSHLTTPGVTLSWKWHDHQKRVIWRIIQAGNTYIDHAVGAGKTAAYIAAGMEMKRMGLINKPIYSVPRSVLQQFANEFQELYPMANIMVADEENFHMDNRRRFIAQATLNNPDAIVITHSVMGLLRMREENIAPVRDAVLKELRDSLADLEESDVGRIRIKQMEKRIDKAQQRFDSMIQRGDNVVTFEDMGVDFIFIDEAHLFRKLDFTTNRQAKGIDPVGSQRAMDLYIKTKWLESQKPGRSHVFGSGTPVTNTIGELYTVMRYFMEPEMEMEGIRHFDAWANIFADARTDPEMNAAGRYEMVERFSKFVNVPEMMARVRTFMDVVTMSQLAGLVSRPPIKGGVPEIVITPPSEALRKYQREELQPRINISREWKPSKDEPGNPDPLINIITDGRLASIDMRFVRSVPNDPNSKLNKWIDGIIEGYRETSANTYLDENGKPSGVKGAGQICFYNLGFGSSVAQRRGFDARAWVMKRLKEAGIPSREVVWFGDYNQPGKKDAKNAMIKELRNGTKRILIGSAKTMGVGLNVQRRMAQEHYLDPPWYPADVEQPDGRILRQGNQNKEVTMKRYATKGSYDGTQWQMVARKSKAIEDAFLGENVRELEDISESSQYEMASALASGDERAIRVAGLRGDIENLRNLQSAHYSGQRTLEHNKSSNESGMKYQRRRIKELEEAEAKVPEYVSDITGKVGSKTYTDKKEFGEAIIRAYRDQMAKGDGGNRSEKIGEINGLPLFFRVWGEGKIGSYGYHEGLNLRITPDVHYDIEEDRLWVADPALSPGGLVRKLVNKLNGLSSETSKHESNLREYEDNQKKVLARLGIPFPMAQEMNQKVAELAQLEGELLSESAAATAADEAQRKAEGKQTHADVVREAREAAQKEKDRKAAGGKDPGESEAEEEAPKTGKGSPLYSAIPLAIPFLMGKGEEDKKRTYPLRPETPSYLPPGLGR